MEPSSSQGPKTGASEALEEVEDSNASVSTVETELPADDDSLSRHASCSSRNRGPQSSVTASALGEALPEVEKKVDPDESLPKSTALPVPPQQMTRKRLYAT